MKKPYLAFLLVGVAATTFFSSAFAGDLVTTDQIVKSLTSIPKAMMTVDGRVVQNDPTVDLYVPFEFKKSTLTSEGKTQLDQLAAAFTQPALAQSRFELAGHTDKVGSHEYNIQLSTERANAVRDYLSKQHGIALNRLLTQGYGFTKLADAQNPKSAANRRVEIRHLLQQSYGAAVQPAVAQQPVTNPAAQPQPIQGMMPAPAFVPAQPMAPVQQAAPAGGAYGGQIIQRP